jgi:bifunctional NMN adenylyltransferase/nudix hydrolase
MPKKSGTAIIIGRFQVVDLNKVHTKLIDKVLRRHEKTHVFLCSNPAPSDLHPIDFIFRIELFDHKYADKLEVHEMPDLPDDRIWSQELDRRILELRPTGSVTLYGTQTGFSERYSGRYTTEILEATPEEIEAMEDVSQKLDMVSFRAGVLYASMRRFPTVYATVDIAVYDEEKNRVLIARKDNETRYRFPGGFTDPSDASYEDAAVRELTEECGPIEVDNLVYLGSTSVDDWRYRETMDSVITHFYLCTYEKGEPVALDDIAEVKWFDVQKLREDMFVPEHRALFHMFNHFFDEMGHEDDDDDE